MPIDGFEVELLLNEPRRKVQEDSSLGRSPEHVRLDTNVPAYGLSLVGIQISEEDGLGVPFGRFYQFPPWFSEQLFESAALLEAAVVETVFSIDVGDPLGVEPVIPLQGQDVRTIAPGLGTGGVECLTNSADGEGLVVFDPNDG